MVDTDQSPFVLENAVAKPDASGNGFPDRYAIKEVETHRILTCLEAPNLQVIIKRGLSVTASAARKAPPGTIYLDGVAQTLSASSTVLFADACPSNSLRLSRSSD